MKRRKPTKWNVTNEINLLKLSIKKLKVQIANIRNFRNDEYHYKSYE